MISADTIFVISFNRRGLNPPHRVKSISMTSFTQQEIETLQGQGNEVFSLLFAQFENLLIADAIST